MSFNYHTLNPQDTQRPRELEYSYRNQGRHGPDESKKGEKSMNETMSP